MVDLRELAKAVEDSCGIAKEQELFVLSPHLDDAVWSMGVLTLALAQAGHRLKAITICSHTLDTAVRKSEDGTATQAAGYASATYLDFDDAILRKRNLKEVFDSYFTAPPELTDPLISSLDGLLPASATVFAPSGFGAHIDHLMTRDIATSLGRNIIYYEDLPYIAQAKRPENAEHFLHTNTTRHPRFQVHTSVIEQHIDLYNLYVSQYDDRHVEQITTYLRNNGFGLALT